MKVIEVFLVILLVCTAIYNFEFYDFNKWLISAVLLLSAASIITKDEKIQSLIRKANWVILIVLLFRLFFA